MLIGLISDTHDNIGAIASAIEVFNNKRVEYVFHAGDFVSAAVADVFRDLDAPLVGVIGNMCRNKNDLIKIFKGIGEISEGLIKVVIENKRIIMTHRPLDEEFLNCDLYVHGHTHEPDISKNRFLIVNPGECCGYSSGNRTVAIVDIGTMTANIIKL